MKFIRRRPEFNKNLQTKNETVGVSVRNISTRFNPYQMFGVVVLVALIGVTLLLNSKASTAIYVSNDSELNTAIKTTAQPGDTIILRQGTYSFTTIYRVFSSPVFIRGEDRANVKIGGFGLSGAANVNISNLTITSIGSNLTSGGAILINNTSTGSPVAHDITIQSVTITGGKRNVVVSAQGKDASFWPYNINIVSSDLSSAEGDNIQLQGVKNMTIDRNNIHSPIDNADHNDGIQVIASSGLKITNNKLTNPASNDGNDQAIIVGRGDPFNANLYVDNTLIINNLIYQWGVGSGLLIAGATNTQIVNNTVEPGTPGKTAGSGFVISRKYPTDSNFANTGLYVWNNIFNRVYLSTNAQRPDYESNNAVRSGGGGSSLITTDPLYVSTDPNNVDKFKLSSQSKLINSGTTRSGTPALDIDNNKRDTTPDIGAKEVPVTAVSDSTAPSTPINLKAVAGSSTTVNLSWDASADNVSVSGYSVYRNDVFVGNTTITTYSDANLSPSTSYQYYVKAFDAAGNVSPASTVASTSTLSTSITPTTSSTTKTATFSGTLSKYSSRTHDLPLAKTGVASFSVSGSGRYDIKVYDQSGVEVSHTQNQRVPFTGSFNILTTGTYTLVVSLNERASKNYKIVVTYPY